MPQSLSFEPIQEPARTPFPSGAGGEAARHLVGCSRVAVRAASDHAYRILTGMCLESMRPLSRGHGFFKYGNRRGQPRRCRLGKRPSKMAPGRTAVPPNAPQRTIHLRLEPNGHTGYTGVQYPAALTQRLRGSSALPRRLDGSAQKKLIEHAALQPASRPDVQTIVPAGDASASPPAATVITRSQ